MQLPNNIPTAINFHLWKPCNMRCKFCFATFADLNNNILPKGHLPKNEALKVVQKIAQAGFQKITFAGGEPTLCPWLFQLMELAKNMGMTTMIVTNGSKINDDFLTKFKPVLDWITLSIDSLNNHTNRITGRAITGKTVLTKQYYLDACAKIHQHGFRLKINTVVTNKNYQEDLNEFIETTKPERWKVFQVLPIKGENDACINSLLISDEQFKAFLDRHLSLHKNVLIKESNEDMTASYVMVDPAGRFYSNKMGKYCYSEPILKVGIPTALKMIDIEMSRFLQRDGNWDWT